MKKRNKKNQKFLKCQKNDIKKSNKKTGKKN